MTRAVPHRPSALAVADEADAALLEIPAGSPVLIVERITRNAEGRPVLVSEHVVPAHRMRFVVDLPVDGGVLDPSGMRLVDPESG